MRKLLPLLFFSFFCMQAMAQLEYRVGNIVLGQTTMQQVKAELTRLGVRYEIKHGNFGKEMITAYSLTYDAGFPYGNLVWPEVQFKGLSHDEIAEVAIFTYRACDADIAWRRYAPFYNNLSGKYAKFERKETPKGSLIEGSVFRQTIGGYHHRNSIYRYTDNSVQMNYMRCRQ